MKLAVISFTKEGSQICGKLVKRVQKRGIDCQGYVIDRFLDALQEIPQIYPLSESVGAWTRAWFDQVDGLIYIGAAGIAVRAIAPCLKDKMTDPAVVVVDEKGTYAISLLSGHIGGANELAVMIGDILGARPVITTASDVQNKTAIDLWAKKRGLRLSDRVLARQVAARVLDGEPVGFYSDYPLREPVPEGFGRGDLFRMNVWITARRRPDATDVMSMFLPEGSELLRLIPRVLIVGVGCRKGTDRYRILETLMEVLARENLDPAAIRELASIDLKAEEAGILEAAGELGVPFSTFSAEELEAVPGSFTASPFVRDVTGTDNVCERAAMAAAGESGTLLVHKQTGDGVTIAVAEIRPEIG